MVRTQSQAIPRTQPIDSSRVLALSTAIGLHLLAAGLLLIPLSQHPLTQPAVAKERWQVPINVPTPPVPPAPPVVVPVVVEFTPLKTHTATPTTPIKASATQAAVVDNTSAALPPLEATPATGSADSVASSGPVEAGQLHYLSAPAPSYPVAALRAGLQGTVVLRVLVDIDGRPSEVSIQTSSGHRALDLAARSQVLRSWRFQPALQNGQPVQAYGLVPVSFSLE